MNIHLVSTMTFGNSGWRNGVRPFSLLASEPFFLISLNSLFRFLFHYLCCQFACDTIKKIPCCSPLFQKSEAQRSNRSPSFLSKGLVSYPDKEAHTGFRSPPYNRTVHDILQILCPLLRHRLTKTNFLY